MQEAEAEATYFCQQWHDWDLQNCFPVSNDEKLEHRCQCTNTMYMYRQRWYNWYKRPYNNDFQALSQTQSMRECPLTTEPSCLKKLWIPPQLNYLKENNWTKENSRWKDDEIWFQCTAWQVTIDTETTRSRLFKLYKGPKSCLKNHRRQS